MATTQTNGVDFALYVGSICLVTFTNGLYYKKSMGDLTLNINSTGAKEFWFKLAGMTTYSGSVGLNERADNNRYTGAPYMGLWIYDGSIYIYQGVDFYNDYPDYE